MTTGGGATDIAVAVLGPTRITVGGAEVVLSAARERAVLSRLALDAGRSVSDDELIAAVWGEDPPATARATLQTYISHLRRTIGAQAIVRDSNGYRLCGATVDVQVFGETVRAARTAPEPGARVQELRRALDLWRGAPLADLAEDAATADRAGLEEERVLVTEQLLEARLASEPPGAVVPALEELCRRQPLREHAAGLLMTALYRAGRQADALAAYRRLRAGLIEEFGLEPSTTLRELEGRILRQDPTLDPVPPRPTADVGSSAASVAALPLPPRLTGGRDGDTFVGRREELRRVLEVLDQVAAGGTVHTVVLRGEAGIGKTRLAREVGLTAAGRSWLVTWGRCPADGGGAFDPIAEALDPLVRWRGDLVAGREPLLASVLPSVAALTSDPLAILRAGSSQRYALLDALAAVTAAATATAPLLLAVDDLHWADAGTVAFLEHLATRREMPVVVLATARSPEPTESAHVAMLLERLGRDHDMTLIEVGGLSQPEVRAMVDRTTSVPARVDAVAALHAKTGGNPFFVGEVLAALGDDGIDELGDELGLTAGVQAVLAHRFDHLDERQLDVLAAAAAIGTEFDVGAVAACAEVPEPDALRALERATAMALVEEGVETGTFSFRHGLVQTAIWGRTARARRARLEERAASLEAARTMAEPGALGRRVANRLLANAADGPAASAQARLDERDPLLAASKATLLRIAAGVTPLMSRPGVEVVVASELTDERAGRTVLRWARSMHHRGDSELALARAVECGELARQLGSPALLVEAADVAAECAGMLPGRRRRVVGGDVHRLIADASQAAAGGAPDAATRARMLVHLAASTPDASSRPLLATAALRAARDAGERRWEAEALLATRWCFWGPGGVSERLAAGSGALALADELGLGELAQRIRLAYARDLVAADRLGDATDQLAMAVASEALHADLRGPARLEIAAIDLARGARAAAAETIEWAAAGAHHGIDNDPYDPLATLLLVLAIEDGQLADAGPSLAAAVQRWPGALLWHGARAASSAAADDRDATVRHIGACRSLAARGVVDGGGLVGLVLLWQAATAVGQPIAASLRRQLASHADEVAVAGAAGILGKVGDLLDR